MKSTLHIKKALLLLGAVAFLGNGCVVPVEERHGPREEIRPAVVVPPPVEVRPPEVIIR
jgi:hypothetical protein